ncbi:hypothetical protein JRO89_XS10G0173900 [Xanthoceras sorbifolium]|uniref:Uncharacterized protein n=1 Tax=Xanthoceras sorbifolium TaxID=99658 RepID=A0ABQ8HJ47_9ROSI|nr:hypothetical protein JRO89_XS10G0173900 [Xanthoceras sorbifolium]
MSKKKISGMVKLKIVVEKLHKSLLMGRRSSSSSYYDDDYEKVSDSRYVPEDVKEGHFAVIAVDGDQQPKRFVIPLSYLSHPRFLELLEQAAEEYGFDHEGALAIPCRPCELERILADQRWPQEGDSSSSTGSSLGVNNWRSCETMVPIC